MGERLPNERTPLLKKESRDNRIITDEEGATSRPDGGKRIDNKTLCEEEAPRNIAGVISVLLIGTYLASFRNLSILPSQLQRNARTPFINYNHQIRSLY